MFETFRKAAKGRQGCIRLMVCIALHMILMQSVCQGVLVLYLLAAQKVDEMMIPSLIISLIAAILSILFIILHAILFSQHKRRAGASIPQHPLNTVCSYLLRAMVVVWLAAAVAGLLVIAKQPGCMTGSGGLELWQAGIGCDLYRTVVVIAVLTFATTCSLFFSIEVCESPFVASLLSVSTPDHNPQSRRKLSAESYDTLPPGFSHVYNETDARPGNRKLYWSSNHSALLEKPAPVHAVSIRHPGPARLRPQLRINTNPSSIHPEISGVSEVCTSENSPKASPTLSSQLSTRSLKRMVSTLSGQRLSSEPDKMVENEDVPAVPKVPAAVKTIHKHQRQKSSVSSRLRFLPKALAKSVPLSEDPAIQEWSSPHFSARFDPIEPLPQSSPISTSATSVFTANADNSSISSTSHDTFGRADSTTSSVTHKPHSVKSDVVASAPSLTRYPLAVRRSRTSGMDVRARYALHQHSVYASERCHHASRPISPSHRAARHSQSGKSVWRTNMHSVNRQTRPGHTPHMQSHTKPYSSYDQHTYARKEYLTSQHKWQQQSPYPLYPAVRQPRRNHSQNYTRREVSYASHRGRGASVRTTHPDRNFSQGYQQEPPPPSHPLVTSSFAHNQPRQAPRRPPSIPPFSVLNPPQPHRDDTATIYPATRRPRSNTFGGLTSVSEISPTSSSSSFSSLIPYYQTGPYDKSNSSFIRTRSPPVRSSLSLNMGSGGVMSLDEDQRLLGELNSNRTYRGAERTSLSSSSSVCGISALAV